MITPTTEFAPRCEPASPDTGGAQAAAAAPSADRRLLRRTIGLCVLGLVGFVAGAFAVDWGIDRLKIRPAAPQPFAAKLGAVQAGNQSQAPYDVLFLGSSRFHHGIDPARFDAATARQGVITHSFNVGVDALNFPETLFLIDRLLELNRGRATVLVIEPSMRARLAPGLDTTQRAIALHDWPGARRTFGLVLDGNIDTGRKVFWSFSHARVTALRMTNTGALTSHYIREAEPGPDLAELLGPAGDGYSPLTDATGKGLPVSAADVEKVVADQRAAEKAGRARTLNTFELNLLDELRRKAADAGATLVLLTPPTIDSDIFGEFSAIGAARDHGLLKTPALVFSDPAKYPQLYEPAGFYDPDHIKADVAGRFTELAADAIVANVLRPAGPSTQPARYPSGKGAADAVH